MKRADYRQNAIKLHKKTGVFPKKRILYTNCLQMRYNSFEKLKAGQSIMNAVRGRNRKADRTRPPASPIV